jgi:branched-chain amino acid transport system substrate-binding protein
VIGARGRVAAVLVSGVLLVGCGTRLPDSAFRATPTSTSTSTATPTPTSSGGATEVGVTATSIKVGNIVSRTNPFDPQAFVGPFYGAKAYFDALNAKGGVNGRRIVFDSCDDSGSGIANTRCAHQLIDTDRVFAMVSNAILTYTAADYVNTRGVPDVGSQPIDNAYTRYHHLWDIYGESYPRNGTIGYDGVLSGGTEVYRWFKVRYPSVPRRAGVVYYNQSSSQKFGSYIAKGLRVEGFSVVEAQVNFALPDYDSAVIKMSHAGVRYVFDALDRQGNERLCLAMDNNRLDVTAKVTTTQSWDASVRNDFARSPRCRNTLFATGNTLNYDDTQRPQVAAFRAAMADEGWDTVSTMSEWALEGWAGAQWFTDAVASCGDTVTRACVERYLSRPQEYDGHGLLTPRAFTTGSHPGKSSRNCLNVVRWQNSAHGGRGGWVAQVPDMDRNCFVVPSVTYRP